MILYANALYIIVKLITVITMSLTSVCTDAFSDEFKMQHRLSCSLYLGDAVCLFDFHDLVGEAFQFFLVGDHDDLWTFQFV